MHKTEKQGEELNRKVTVTETQQCTSEEWTNQMFWECDKSYQVKWFFHRCLSAYKHAAHMFRCWLRGISGAADTFLCPAPRTAAHPRRFLWLRLHQPGLMSKAGAFLSCLPHTPSQQSPFRAWKRPSVGNAGLQVSRDRQFNLCSPCTILVSAET